LSEDGNNPYTEQVVSCGGINKLEALQTLTRMSTRRPTS
jgi:hypothetical protein